MEQDFVYALLTVLLTLLAWIGNRIHTKIDFLTERLEEKLDDVNRTLGSIERDLRNDLIEHDKRIGSDSFQNITSTDSIFILIYRIDINIKTNILFYIHFVIKKK